MVGVGLLLPLVPAAAVGPVLLLLLLPPLLLLLPAEAIAHFRRQ